jgi:DNA-directed RNA polymerase subunit RPC12/RpoP
MKCSYCGRGMNTGTGWGENDYLCTTCSQLPDAVIEEKLGNPNEDDEEKEFAHKLS